MANISQVEVNNTTYSICDAVARDSISQKISKSGDTMTGELYSSFSDGTRGMVMNGSMALDANTLPNQIEKIRFSSGAMGSVSLTENFTYSNITIPKGWYTYVWMPHRTGGVNGQEKDDNCDYGTLLMFEMATTGKGFYMIKVEDTEISLVKKVATTNITAITRTDFITLEPNFSFRNGSCQLRDDGLMIFSLSVTSSVAHSAWENVQIGTLKTNYRPRVDTWCGDGHSPGVIGTDGKVWAVPVTNRAANSIFYVRGIYQI